MGSLEKFLEMVKLLKNKEYSPTKLSRELNADKRTVDKMITTAEKLNLVSCRAFKIEGKTYKACSLTPDYKQKIRRENHE